MDFMTVEQPVVIIVENESVYVLGLEEYTVADLDELQYEGSEDIEITLNFLTQYALNNPYVKDWPETDRIMLVNLIGKIKNLRDNAIEDEESQFEGFCAAFTQDLLKGSQ
jgi:hypothetical protein